MIEKLLIRLLANIRRRRNDPPTDRTESSRAVDCDELMRAGLDALHRLDISGATTLFHQMTEEYPNDPRGFVNLGASLLKEGCPDKALSILEHARRLAPNSSEAVINYALALRALGKQDVAVDTLSRFTLDHSDQTAAQCMLVNILGETHGPERALSYLKDVFATQAPDARLYIALADQLTANNNHAEAELRLAQALELDPHNHVALTALGRSLRRRGEFGVAEEISQKAIDTAPTNPEANFNISLVHLARREYGMGWQGYEYRYMTNERPVLAPGIPLWQPKEPPPQHVLVIPEQGLGDEVMFASCIPSLLNEVNRVTLACDKRLAKLFRRSFPMIDVVAIDRRRPNFGFLIARPTIERQVAIGSLPSRYRDSVESFPPTVKFLVPNALTRETLRSRLLNEDRVPIVGIAWRGGTNRTARQDRLIPLQDVLWLQNQLAAHFVTLQHDATPEEIARLTSNNPARFLYFPNALTDIDDTAVLISACDVVIGVPSTVIHLAGAMGIPTWVLTPAQSDWRYGTTETNMDWYSSVRLIRKQRGSTWEELIRAAGSDLVQYLSSNVRAPPHNSRQ